MEHGPSELQYTPRTLAALGRNPNARQDFGACVNLGLRAMKPAVHPPSIQHIVATRDYGRLCEHIANDTSPTALLKALELLLASAKSRVRLYSPHSPFGLMLFAITDAMRAEGGAPANMPWAKILSQVADAELRLAGDPSFDAWFAARPTPAAEYVIRPPVSENELLVSCSERLMLLQVAGELGPAYPNRHVPRDVLFQAAHDRARALIAGLFDDPTPKDHAWAREFMIRAIKANSYFAVSAVIESASQEGRDYGEAFDALLPPASWWPTHKERLIALLHQNGFGMTEAVRGHIEFGNPMFAATLGIHVSPKGALPDFDSLQWNIDQLVAYYGSGGINVKLAPIPPVLARLKEFLRTDRNPPTLVIRSRGRKGITVVGFDPSTGRVATSTPNVAMLLSVDGATGQPWPYIQMPRATLHDSNPVGRWLVEGNPTALHTERAFWIAAHFHVSAGTKTVKFV